MKIKELFADQSRWTKGTNARTRGGIPTETDSTDAFSFCLYGAAVFCYPEWDERKEVFRKIDKKLDNRAIEIWNDATKRSFEDVRALVEELDI